MIRNKKERKGRNLSHRLRRNKEGADSINKESFVGDVTVKRPPIVFVIFHAPRRRLNCSCRRIDPLKPTEVSSYCRHGRAEISQMTNPMISSYYKKLCFIHLPKYPPRLITNLYFFLSASPSSRIPSTTGSLPWVLPFLRHSPLTISLFFFGYLRGLRCLNKKTIKCDGEGSV